MPHANPGGERDDFASVDEVKVYKDEGEEEKRSSENLSEDKLGLVNEGEEDKKSEDCAGFPRSNTPNGQNGSIKISEYPSRDRLPFGYPMLFPLPYSTTAGFPSPNRLIQPPGTFPPPAHMGIFPLYIDPKTGLPRHPMYSIPSPSHLTPSLYPADFSHGMDVKPLNSPSFHSPSLSSSPFGWLNHGFFPPGFPRLPASPGMKSSHSPGRDLPEDYRCQHISSEPKTEVVEKKRPYIKKPLNAYMLFMKEMRQSVIDECTLKESAAINQILGRKWHALDQSEQAKYYEMARKEKELHSQLYPGWSARDNYASHTKRKKRRRDELLRENVNRDEPGLLNESCRKRLSMEHRQSQKYKTSISENDSFSDSSSNPVSHVPTLCTPGTPQENV